MTVISLSEMDFSVPIVKIQKMDSRYLIESYH